MRATIDRGLLGPAATAVVIALLTAPLALPSSAAAASAPAIESVSVSHVTATDATLEARIDTEGQGTTYEFHLLERWWCEEVPPVGCLPAVAGFPLPSGRLLGSFVGQSVSVDLNSVGVTLAPRHDFYEYWVTATSAAGTAEGPHRRFTTSREGEEAEPLGSEEGEAVEPLDSSSSGAGEDATTGGDAAAVTQGGASRQAGAPPALTPRPRTCKHLIHRARRLRHRSRVLRRRAAHSGRSRGKRRLLRRSRRLARAAGRRASRGAPCERRLR